ncbi:MAG: DUF1256 domain-containing protein [Clostridia bacterium]|nr:DUF1256 domain-containing protein [Clostridia bacterium]
MREFLRIYGMTGEAGYKLSAVLQRVITGKSEVVFLCVGTDRVVFDSLGCMVGSILKSSKIPYYVYGDMSKCITGKNVMFAVDYIRTMHRDCILCVVDALATREQCHLNEIVVASSYVSSLSSELRIDGDIFVYGVTTILGSKLGQGTKLLNVYHLAQNIAKGIMLAVGNNLSKNEVYEIGKNN